MPLDLTSLENALASLADSLQIHKDYAHHANAKLVATLRAGVIQNFEVAYELAWKMLQRWLQQEHFSELENHALSRRDLYRLGAKYGLIRDPLEWFSYGEARNISSHSYNDRQAELVFQSADPFLAEARILLEHLKQFG